MEGWLQGSDCGRPWGPPDILQGEAPRGDVHQGPHLLQGTAREQSGSLGGQGRGRLVRCPPWSPPAWPQDASRALGSPLGELACWESLSDFPSCLSPPAMQSCRPTDLSFSISCPVVFCSFVKISL